MPSKYTDFKIATIQMAILAALCGWLFYPELKHMTAQVTSSSDSVHSLVAPLVIILLIYCRRESLVEQMTTGTFWGLAFRDSGILLYAACRWPFDFGYVCYLTILPVLAGIILLGGGWRLSYSTLSLLLVLMIAIPMGSRLWPIVHSSYLVKPVEFGKFSKLMNDLGFYWLGWNRQPGSENFEERSELSLMEAGGDPRRD